MQSRIRAVRREFNVGRETRRHASPATVVAMVAALAAGLLSPVQTAYAAGAGEAPPAPESARVVGSLAPDVTRATTPIVDKPVAVESIEPQKRTLTLSDDADATELGDTGITVASTDVRRGGDARVAVEVLGAEDREELGDVGLALEITPTASNLDDIAVTVPDSVVAGLAGADSASRIRWTAVPSDDASHAARDAETARVSRAQGANTVKVSGAEPMIIIAASSTVGNNGSGSYAVTPSPPARSWGESVQTGAFTWSYPIPASPAPAGDTPALALDYNSQLVDRATASTNNQPSATGEGWNLSGGGFIERRYVPCAQEQSPGTPVAGKADLCWATDNATISFGGRSGALVRDSATGTWKLQGDDNSRIEKLVGTARGCRSNGTYNTECWLLTTTDGTKYYFGLNQLPGWTSGKETTDSVWTVPVFGNNTGDPCKASTFANSACKQGWRWNLDLVVDVHGNAQAFYYKAEKNNYRLNNTTPTAYVRGGQLARVDYGLKTSTIYAANAATGRIVFGYSTKGRCNPATPTKCSPITLGGYATTPKTLSAYPDVPFDLNCTGGACTGRTAPSFWTTARLVTITTQTFTSSKYRAVDQFTLKHSFPDPGDSQSPALWLDSVQRTARPGTTQIEEGATTFQKTALQNRVWVTDGLAPLDKFRISSVNQPTGAQISVNYSRQECTPAMAPAILAAPWSNTKRCFPMWWTPDPKTAAQPRRDLFHLYVVTSIVEDPHTGGGGAPAIRTNYVYTGGTPGWRYVDDRLAPANRRTWSEYAGYDTVEVRVGDPANPTAQRTTQYRFYRGLDGDRLNASGGQKSVTVTGTSIPDSRWFGGLVNSESTLNGVGGAVVSQTVTTPWASSVTSNDGLRQSRVIGAARQDVTVPISTGGTRTTSTINTMDARGLVTAVSKEAGAGQRNTCTTTAYAPDNTAAWILGVPSDVTEYSIPCADVPTAPIPSSVLSHKQMAYDGAAVGAAPSKGLLTAAYEAESFTGATLATAKMVPSNAYAYDALGRTTSSTDAASRVVQTAYSPSATAAAGSGPLISTTVTNALGWTTKTTDSAYRGLPIEVVDENGKSTTTEYDALGRLTKVWKTDRPKTANPTSPSIAYAYGVSTTKPSYVKSTTVAASGLLTAYTLMDGLGRTVQTQAPMSVGGAVISDTEYDGQGRQIATNDSYWAPAVTPGATLFVPATTNQISSRIGTRYDAAGRPTATLLRSFGTEIRRTTTAYRGSDRVDVTPPSGGIPTSTFADAWGQTVRTTQWLGAIDGASKVSLSYEYNGRGQMTRMVDDAGNQWLTAYSQRGYQTSTTDPDAGTTSYAYDAVGNIVTTTDAAGRTLAYEYDSLNRKTAERSDSASGPVLASWTYDTLAKGQLTSSSRFADGLEYKSATTGYDDGYRPTGSTVSIPAGAPAFAGTAYTTRLYYDVDGSLLRKSVPAVAGLPQEDLSTAHNTLGQQTALSGAVSYASSVSYYATGQIGQITRPGVVWSALSFGYDDSTRLLSSITETTRRHQTEFTDEAVREYTRNPAGIITRASTTSPGLATDVQCYTYNGLQALTDAWTPADGNCAAGPTAALGGPASYRESFAVDPVSGNRTSATTWAGSTATTSTYTYPAPGAARPHALSQASTVAGTGSPSVTGFAHDATGAMTARGSQALTYDQSGRLATATTGSATEKSLYTADGSLLMRWGGSEGASLFLGDTTLRTKADITTGIRSYSIAGVPIAERVSGDGGGLWWLSPDAVGTVDLEINAATGGVTRRWMDPFGADRGPAATWSSSSGFLNAPRSATGLTQLGARGYDSGLGRFITADAPLDPSDPSDPRSLSPYAYAFNSPMSYSDPNGRGAQGFADSLGVSSFPTVWK